MREKLLNDIREYVGFLNNHGLYVTIHGGIDEYIYKLAECNIHKNPFCLLVKSDDAAWQKCINSQCKIYASGRKEPFWGMCHAGLEEYIFPVCNKKMLAFVSVSGYALNRPEAVRRINALAKEFLIDRKELINTYDGLAHDKPDSANIRAVINPLCDMILLLNLLKPAENTSNNEENAVYNRAVSYARRNFMNNISVSDTAGACRCSVSTLCHTFKKYGGVGIKEYINSLRLENAARLLKSTTLPINHIADLSGFADSDYFSTAFKKHYKVSPTEFRKSNKEL